MATGNGVATAYSRRSPILWPVLILALVLLFAYQGMTIQSKHPQAHLEKVTVPYKAITYEIVTGFFVQDEPHTNQAPASSLLPRFGLKDASPQRWERFTERVHVLNKYSGPHVSYKVIFLGRHGQGVHNVAEAYYGAEVSERT
ncbi:hypothetical protein FRB94_013995 [Tulasnella sp. JGI-2019a]|nr:hypothetical protein FRB93_002016 [Tulasnella sp. JGI-2019a]KAG9007760.1 hypothetical protein FRB94_013995 [Tulasnella sp. JGI-2019a]